MLKKTMVYAWLLAGLTTGCPLDSAGTDDTSTGNNDSTDPDDSDGDGTTPDDHKPSDGPKPGDGDGDQPGDGDGDQPGDGDGDQPGEGDGDTPPLDAGTDPLTDSGTAPLDAGSEETPDAGPEEPEDAGVPIEVPDLGGADMLDADRAARILQVMTEQNYRENWKPFLQETAGPRGLVVTPSHGNAVHTWLNPVAEDAVKKWAAQGMPLPLVMPNGSIVVKEIYKLDTATGKYSLTGTSVMSKVTALPATFEGQWFYSKISLTNEATVATTCANCHNGRSAKAVWPVDPNIPDHKGGLADGVVPYDYLFVAFCADERTPQCAAPGAPIDPFPM